MKKHTTTECLLFPDLLDKPVVVKFDQEHASSDGGALLLKAADRRLNLIDSLSACLPDGRQEGKLTHSLTDLVAQRAYGIACGYADCNDTARLASLLHRRSAVWPRADRLWRREAVSLVSPNLGL